MTAKEFGTKGPRSIYPEMCDSSTLGRCSILTNALWPRIVVSCDDQGRMAGNAADVLGECFPKMLAKVRIKDVDASLKELATARAIIRYKINGEEYLQVRSWWAWQQYARRAYPSRMPAPEGWSDYVYGRVGDTFATWRDAAGMAARQGRGLHVENLYDEDLPSPTEWPEPQDFDSTNRTLTAPEPQDNGTVPLGGEYLPPLARAQSRPVPSRPVPSRPVRAEPPNLTEAIKGVEKLSGRPWTDRPGSKCWDTLEANVRDFGAEKVLKIMAAQDRYEHPNARQLVYWAEDILHKLEKPSLTGTTQPKVYASDLRKGRQGNVG